MTPKPDIEPVATLVERLKPVAFARPDVIDAMRRGASFWDTTLTSKPDQKEHTTEALYPASALLALEGERDALLDAAKRARELLNKGAAGWGVSKDILGEAIAKAAPAALSSSEHI
jgi:hypothetical protein